MTDYGTLEGISEVRTEVTRREGQIVSALTSVKLIVALDGGTKKEFKCIGYVPEASLGHRVRIETSPRDLSSTSTEVWRMFDEPLKRGYELQEARPISSRP